MRVGVDVGGTFTDLVAVASNGAVRIAKVLTTPDHRSRGVLQAVQEGVDDPRHVERFVHGTTVVTNLLLERAGSRVVLLATDGMTDLLWLRRQERAALYDLTRDHAAPLVAPSDVIGVRERVAPRWFVRGERQSAPDAVEVITALTTEEVERVVAAAQVTGANSFAVVLLHAYAHTAHEQQIAAALRAACPHAVVVASHEVLPEIREYERMATVTVEAYARHAVRQYLQDLSRELVHIGMPAPRVMTSSGGTVPVALAEQQAASLALSGPAGGITAAAALCRALGVHEALTIDIGGTSADVGVVAHGEPLIERGGTINGIPIALPRVLVETVAAGGGSLARLDAGGALQVGPESAGALPGPACYGRGGERPTVTDAHVVLEHIAAGTWGGAVTISTERALTALQPLADALQRSVHEVARAVIATADATMARALRRVSVERGQDPRDAVLVAFGGGGPLHACGLADALGMTRIFIPPWAGVLSAVGLAVAPERREAIASVMRRGDALHDVVLQEAVERALTELRSGVSTTDVAAPVESTGDAVRVWARVRYAGQGHDLDIPSSVTPTVNDLHAAFADAHAERFGYTLDRPLEVVSVRVAREGAWWPLAAHRPDRMGPVPPLDADDGLLLDRVLHGPHTVRLPDSTLRIALGWSASALATGGWWMTRGTASEVLHVE